MIKDDKEKGIFIRFNAFLIQKEGEMIRRPPTIKYMTHVLIKMFRLLNGSKLLSQKI